MNTPERPSSDLGAVYRRRKRLGLLSSTPFFILAAVAILARITSGRFLGIPFSIAGPVAYVTFLVTFVAHVFIWRCPACEGYLGLAGSCKFCPKCGARLDERAFLRASQIPPDRQIRGDSQRLHL